MIPTFAAPMGPRNGRPERVKAALAAIIDIISESFSLSCDSRVQNTCVSFLKFL